MLIHVATMLITARGCAAVVEMGAVWWGGAYSHSPQKQNGGTRDPRAEDPGNNNRILFIKVTPCHTRFRTSKSHRVISALKAQSHTVSQRHSSSVNDSNSGGPHRGGSLSITVSKMAEGAGTIRSSKSHEIPPALKVARDPIHSKSHGITPALKVTWHHTHSKSHGITPALKFTRHHVRSKSHDITPALKVTRLILILYSSRHYVTCNLLDVIFT